MKIRLNLATAPLASERRFIVGATTAGLAGVLAMFVLAWHAFTTWQSRTMLRRQETEITADMSRLRARRNTLEQYFNRPEIVQQRDIATFFNSLIAERAFPWTKIFMDLEKSLPTGARVVSVEPTLVANHIELRLTVEALNDQAKLDFLKDLEQSSEFSEVQLLSEHRATEQAGEAPIVLSLVAHYSAS